MLVTELNSELLPNFHFRDFLISSSLAAGIKFKSNLCFLTFFVSRLQRRVFFCSRSNLIWFLCKHTHENYCQQLFSSSNTDGVHHCRLEIKCDLRDEERITLRVEKNKLWFSICIMKTFCMEITCFLPSLCSPQKLFLHQISIRISQATGRQWKETKTAQDSTFLWKLCYLNRCLILVVVHENLQDRVCWSMMDILYLYQNLQLFFGIFNIFEKKYNFWLP